MPKRGNYNPPGRQPSGISLAVQAAAVREVQRLREELERDLLGDEASYIQGFCANKLGGIDLEPFQIGLIRSQASSIISLKSRRVGWTWGGAAKGFYRSQNIIRKTIPYCYEKNFISRNLDESKEKILIARQLFDWLPENRRLKLVVDAKTELVFEDSRGRLSRLKALTSNEPRSMGGDIDFDEAAFLKDFRKLYKAGRLVTARGGDLSIGSSPAEPSGLFYEIWTNEKGKFGNFQRWKIPWWLSAGLCTNVQEAAREAPGMSTEERVLKYGTPSLLEIFETSILEDFQTETETIFSDESASFFSWDMIRANNEPFYGDSLDAEGVKMVCVIRDFQNSQVIPDEQFWRGILGARKGAFEVGFDVGRKKHISALVVTDRFGSDRKEVRAIIKLSKYKFDDQGRIISDCINILKPYCFNFDATGEGAGLGETLEQRFPSIFRPVKFNNANKQDMITKLKLRFERKNITIPAWHELESNLHSIKKTQSGGIIRYEADTTEHHGDITWALALTEHEVAASFAPSVARIGKKKTFSRDAL